MEQADKYRGRKSKAGLGLESLQRSREAEEEGAEDPTVGASLASQSPAFGGSQDPPCTLLSFPLINPACTLSQLRPSLTLAPPECCFSHPLSTHYTARHCAKCLMLAIPFCLNDAEIGPKCPFVKWAFYLLYLTTFLKVSEQVNKDRYVRGKCINIKR